MVIDESMLHTSLGEQTIKNHNKMIPKQTSAEWMKSKNQVKQMTEGDGSSVTNQNLEHNTKGNNTHEHLEFSIQTNGHGLDYTMQHGNKGSSIYYDSIYNSQSIHHTSTSSISSIVGEETKGKTNSKIELITDQIISHIHQGVNHIDKSTSTISLINTPSLQHVSLDPNIHSSRKLNIMIAGEMAINYLQLDFLKDVMVSFPDGPTPLIISNLKLFRHGTQMISNKLGYGVIVYDTDIAWSHTDIPVNRIKYDTGKNLLYIIILDNSEVSTELALLKMIREKDYTSNILFVITKDDYNKVIGRILNANYYGIYFAYMIGNKMQHYHVMEICAYCNHGKNSANLINRWKLKSGFKTPLKFQSSFKGNFYGAKLKVSTNLVGPNYIFKEGNDYFGHDYLLMLHAMNTFNFTWEFIHPNPVSWGKKVGNIWNGIIGHITYKQADLGLGSVSLTWSRFQVINPTAAVAIEPVVFLTRKPSRSPRWQAVFEAFTWKTWLATIVCALLVGCVLYAIYRYSPLENKISLSMALLRPFKVLLMEPIWNKYSSVANIMLLGIWIMGSFVLVFYYIAAMQAAILKPGYNETLINTPEEFNQSGKMVMVPTGFYWGLYLEEVYGLKRKVRYMNSSLNLDAIVLQNGQNAKLANRYSIYNQAVQALDSEGTNPFYYGKQTLMTSINLWVVSKDCLYRDDLAKFIMESHQYGFIKYFASQMISILKKVARKEYGEQIEEADTKKIFISLEYFMALLHVLKWAYIAPVLVLIGEIAYSRLYHIQGKQQGVSEEVEVWPERPTSGVVQQLQALTNIDI